MLDYLESAYPNAGLSLLPADPALRAKVLLLAPLPPLVTLLLHFVHFSRMQLVMHFDTDFFFAIFFFRKNVARWKRSAWLFIIFSPCIAAAGRDESGYGVHSHTAIDVVMDDGCY